MNTLEEMVPRYNAAWDALEGGDLDGFIEVVRDRTHADCEFSSGIGSVVGGDTFQGIEGLRSWFGDLIATTSERHWYNRRYEERAEDVHLFLADFEFTGAASGATIQNESGAVFQYEDGLCIRIDSFMSYAEAREFAEARVA